MKISSQTKKNVLKLKRIACSMSLDILVVHIPLGPSFKELSTDIARVYGVEVTHGDVDMYVMAKGIKTNGRDEAEKVIATKV